MALFVPTRQAWHAMDHSLFVGNAFPARFVEHIPNGTLVFLIAWLHAVGLTCLEQVPRCKTFFDCFSGNGAVAKE